MKLVPKTHTCFEWLSRKFCVSFVLVLWELLSFVQVSYNFVHFSCKFYGEKLVQLVLNLIFDRFLLPRNPILCTYPNFHFNTNIKEEAWMFFRKVTASQFGNFFYKCVRYPLILSLFIHCKYLSSNNGEKNSEKLYGKKEARVEFFFFCMAPYRVLFRARYIFLQVR